MNSAIKIGDDEFAAIFKKSENRNSGHIQFTKMIYNSGGIDGPLEIIFDDKENVTNDKSKKNVAAFLKGLVGTNVIEYSGGKRKNTRRKLKKGKRRKSSTKKNT